MKRSRCQLRNMSHLQSMYRAYTTYRCCKEHCYSKPLYIYIVSAKATVATASLKSLYVESLLNHHESAYKDYTTFMITYSRFLDCDCAEHILE